MRKLLVVLAFSLPVFAQTNAISGRVVDDSGAAIPKATVSVYEAKPRIGVSALCPSCWRDCGKRETTAANGEFRIAAVDDKLVFRLLTVAEGYEPALASDVDPRHGALTVTMKKRVSEGNIVRGRVVDPDGKLVVGASVTPQAVREKTRAGFGKIPGVDPLSVTNEHGEFALRTLPGTTLDVRIDARNFARAIEPQLVPGELRTIRLGYGTTVFGRVMKEGKPVAGAAVGFVQKWRAAETYMGVDEIGTDEDGRFVKTGLPPGFEYFVYPKTEPFAPYAVQPKVVCTATEGANVDAGTFELQRGLTIRGRLSEAKRGVEVILIPEYEAAPRVARTDGEGRFVFEGVAEEPVDIRARGMKGLQLTPTGDVEVVLQPGQ
ncbi:MAG TPA: carboxypeptidase-like regulatory domain-containing protein [Thermoanaerobaculia bacterium]|nr:carboxypeptidase-like regulatory domain-containing protein [Thermoanaerobaculia bacterium]